MLGGGGGGWVCLIAAMWPQTLNHGTMDDLLKLKMVGPKRAAKIIAAREERSFRTVRPRSPGVDRYRDSVESGVHWGTTGK